MNIPPRLLEVCSRFPVHFKTGGDRRSRHSLEFQKLEPRVLLAGDVTVFVDSSGLMSVIGDDADNQVLIVGKRLSGAEVIGLNGTTINGGEDSFRAAFLQGLNVQMNGGNDEVDLHAARFSFTASIQGNAGNDMIMVRNSQLNGLNIRGGAGNDLVEIDSVFVTGQSLLQTGTGDDMIALYYHASTQSITVRSGAGNDTMAIDRVGMFDQLNIDMGAGNDNILVAGATWIGEGSNVNLGAGQDFLAVLPQQTGANTQIQKNTNVDTGSEDDVVVIGESVSGKQGIILDGNIGFDGLVSEVGALPGIGVVNFETFSLDYASSLDAIFAELAEEGVDPTRFGGEEPAALDLQIENIPLSYTENDPATPLDGFLNVDGTSNTVVKMATVTITGFVVDQDVLEFSDVGTVTGVFNDATGVLTFSGDGTLTQYQTALRSVTYRNTSESPAETTRTLDVEIMSDEASSKDSRTLNVFAVNDIPVLTLSTDNIEFDIDNGVQRPLLLDQNLTLSDLDTPEFASATVQIVAGGQAGDTLAFDNTDGITADYDPVNRLLKLSGTATVDVWEKALRSVTFDNERSQIPLGIRTIQFETTDNQTLVADQLTVEVVASPTVDLEVDSTNLSYEETAAATPVDPNLTINTGANPEVLLNGATVSIISGLDSSQDQLSFTAVNGIAGNYDAASGVLTFTGNASSNDYQQLLRSVTFFNTSFGDFDFSTADRVVEFSVERAGNNSTASRTINVTEIDSEQELIQRYLDVNNMTSEVTASGLHYIVTQEGNGNFPDANSLVRVNYVGRLLNGQQFDAGDDIEFELNRVIAGWTEGIPKFSESGSGILLIPSNLAYGDQTRPGIPANSILMFEVDLLEVVIP